MNKQCTGCVVSAGTHKPAEALHQHIAEPQTQQTEALDRAGLTAIRLAREGDQHAAETIRAQQARIAELEAICDEQQAGIERLRAQLAATQDYADRMADMQAAPQAVQATVPLPLLVRDIARDLGITVPQACIALKPLGNYSTNSAVTAEMARMLRDHFPAPAHPAEGVPEQAAKLPPLPEPTAFLVCKGSEVTARAWNVDQMRAYAAAALAATQPAAHGMPDGGTPGPWSVRKRFGNDGEVLDCFVTAPDCQGLAYAAEILGDDEYRDGIERKLADCELIATAVNAHRAALAAQAKQGGK